MSDSVQVYEVLTSLEAELQSGEYMDWTGKSKVCSCCYHACGMMP
jgi:hypothetical protein